MKMIHVVWLVFIAVGLGCGGEQAESTATSTGPDTATVGDGSDQADVGGVPRAPTTVTEPTGADVCQIAHASDLVLEVRVASLTPAIDENDILPTHFVTSVELEVVRGIGDSIPAAVRVLVDGRENPGTMTTESPMSPGFHIGEQAVLFLFEHPKVEGSGTYLLTYGSEGKFVVGANGRVSNTQSETPAASTVASFFDSVEAYVNKHSECVLAGFQANAASPEVETDASTGTPAAFPETIP